jgi:branched-chain amino acid transport system ATP-binding protein
VTLLAVEDLHAHYGRGPVLRGVTLDVDVAGVSVVLGANGAGKTTLLRAVCGMVARAGSILFDGARIDRLATERIACLGVAHVPEGRGTFANLTTEENLCLGACARRGPSDRRAIAAVFERVYGIFPRLAERRRQLAGTLSGGEQQMLALGRGLMSSPKLMLLDEPSFGLAPLMVQEIFRILRTINRQDGVSMLLVEQNASIALELADHAYLLETGRIVLSGPSKVISSDESVRRAYLGY